MPRRSTFPPINSIAVPVKPGPDRGKDIYLGPHGSPESKQRYGEVVRSSSPSENGERSSASGVSTSLTVTEARVSLPKACPDLLREGGPGHHRYRNVCRR